MILVSFVRLLAGWLPGWPTSSHLRATTRFLMRGIEKLAGWFRGWLASSRLGATPPPRFHA